jgi:hypothetical protein
MNTSTAESPIVGGNFIWTQPTDLNLSDYSCTKIRQFYIKSVHTENHLLNNLIDYQDFRLMALD